MFCVDLYWVSNFFPFDDNWFFSYKKSRSLRMPSTCGYSKVHVSLSTWHCFRSAVIAPTASANTCPAFSYYSGITHSQKSLGLEAKLYGSLGYTPEYPRKQVVPTMQSLPGLLVLLSLFIFLCTKESRITCKTRKPNDPWNTVSLLGGTFDYTFPQKDRDDIDGWRTTLIILVDWKHFPNVSELF